MKKRITYLLFLICFWCSQLTAQNNCFTCNFDSLSLRLNTQQSHEEKINLLTLLIDKSTLAISADRTIDYIDQLVKANRQEKFINIDPYLQLKVALIEWDNQRLPKALTEFKKAVDLFDREHKMIYELLSNLRVLFNLLDLQEERRNYYQQKLSYYLANGPYQNTASCYHVLGGYYLSKADYNLAITNYLRAAEVYKKFQPNYFYNELIVVGGLYEKWGNLTKATQYLNEALPFLKSQGDSNMTSYALVALSQISLKNNEINEALRYTNEAINYSNNELPLNNFNATYSIALLQKGLVYIYKNEPKTAFDYVFKAKRISDLLHPKINTTAGYLETDYTFYKYNILIKNYRAAEQYLLEAYKKAVSEKSIVLQRKYLRELTGFYQSLGKAGKAMVYSQQYLAINDTIENGQNPFKIAQFENEQKDLKQSESILRLRQEKAIQQIGIRNRNLVVILSLLGLLLVLGLMVFIYRQLMINKKTITTLKKTQRQLIMAEKMASLGELTAGVAHEIQNPMNFVKNFSEVSKELVDEIEEELTLGNIKEAMELTGDIKENLSKITLHSKRADSIVKGMLMHSRQNSEEKEMVTINELMDEYLRLSYHGWRAVDPEFNVEIVKNYDAEIPRLECVPQEIGRVLINLFNNAFYSVNEKKKKNIDSYKPAIYITTHHAGHEVAIEVKDNGVGIAQNVIDKIFQPFYTTKPSGQGTGLGLSLSYDIITKGHGGELKVDTREGQYAAFKITLPL